MEFRILGPLEVVGEDGVLPLPAPQQRALLVLLIVNANRVLSADHILDAVWGDTPPASGTKAIAFHVSRLRDALEPGRSAGAPAGGLATEAGGYVLRVAPDCIDAARFERLARQAHARLADDPAGARANLDAALALWRGEALTDVAYAEFAQPEIRRLEELRLVAQEDRLEADLALGGHVAAVGELEALVEASPLRERLRGLLMLALYRSGRQAEALRVAGAGRRLLSEELGIDPSPELAQLEDRILAQDPGLALPTPAAALARARNPYKGLRAFGEADAGDFFGRESLVARLIARVQDVSHAGCLLVVVGPSGSGKSSVVRAGVIPALRADGAGGRWRIATMVPGTAPFRELAAALATAGSGTDDGAADAAERAGDLGAVLGPAIGRDGERLVLVIDQLEELFVRVAEETREAFLAGLVAALRAGRLVVVATLRADFLHVPLARPDLGELVRAGTELVTPLSRAELERAIARPAAAVGVEVEPALVVEIVTDVERRPGSLPLLEYALTELFERGDGRRLTREGYAAIGGAIGALGRRADEVWQALDAEGRDIARQVLLRLVDVSDAGVATARRATRAELAPFTSALDGDRLAGVLDGLGRGGLLAFDVDRTTGAATVEIAHEALLDHWRRLADWIDEAREDLRTRRRLSDAAAEWEAGGRDADDLASGSKLERFEGWAGRTRLRLTDVERAFLGASTAERDRARQAARRLERGALVARRRLAAVVAFALLIAGCLGAALLLEGQRGAEEGDIATARRLALAATENLGRGRQLSVLLALEAADATAGRGYVVEEAYDALEWSLQEAQVRFPGGNLPAGVRAGPDGPRGAFLVPPERLLRLGTDYVGNLRRALTPDECRRYLASDTCPAVRPPGAGAALGVRTASGAVVSAESLAPPGLAGSHVRILSELPVAVGPLVSPLVADAGVTVELDADGNGDLRARITDDGGAALPDLAIVAQPSYIAVAGRQGWLMDLDGLVDAPELVRDAGRYLSDLGEAPDVAGTTRRFGLPIAASLADLLWYPAGAFAAEGYLPPATWAELQQLATRIARDHPDAAPWCFGTYDGGDPGGSATVAWIEDLVLDRLGLDGYDDWVTGRIRSASDGVRDAWDRFGDVVATPGAVYRGLASAALTPERAAILPMVARDRPDCWLFHGSSSDRPSLRLGIARPAAVPFPGERAPSQGVLGRVYMVVVLHDRPEVRRVAEVLTGTAFAAAIAHDLAPAGVFALGARERPADAIATEEQARLQSAVRDGTFRIRALDTVPDPVAGGLLGDLWFYLHDAEHRGAKPPAADLEFAMDEGWAMDGVAP